ncbi:hypothetical protein MW887_004856 [Aspergillus wentii]|nr:hypothetical protein MW887_004856 [Aspergillus wentii]
MSQFTHRGPESDCLFEAHYDHPESARTCDGCDHDRLVSRQPRVSNDPHIHYGLIASSNKVMKHGQTRDSYARKYGILCFEMEAAGLMDRFPCLVIRGICDYADSHKSKQWQEYAAATAAAYAKELLSVIPISITRASQKAKEVLDSNIPSSDIVRFLALSNRPEWSITHKEFSPYNIFDRLSDYDQDRTCRDYLRKRCPHTTYWILENERFISWFRGEGHPCLWLTGKIGSGKTLVTSTAIDYMIQESKKSGELVAHFFYTHSNRDRLKASHLFESYIKQMLGHLDSMKKPCPPRVRDSIKQLCCPKRNPPTTREIIDEIFFPFCELLPRTTYVADGIDECDPKEVIETLKTFREVTLRHGTKVLISGREDLDVAQFVSGCIKMTMSENDTRRDIRRFIEWKIEEKMWERELTKDQSLLQDVKSKLNGNAERMILWVNLQLEALWEECFTDTDIRNALANLPKDLAETYNRCLARIDKKYRPFTRKILPWAFAIDTSTGCIDWGNIVPARELLKSCSNLVTRDIYDQIFLVHYSVRQFLESQKNDDWILSARFEMNKSRLDLGELCIHHLSSSTYSRAAEASNANSRKVDMAPVMRKLSWTIPFLSKPEPLQISWPPMLSRASTTRETPSFFNFARDQWAPLTSELTSDSEYWNEFQTLALEPNLSWKIHPWEPLGESLNSHFCGLLGWAIAYRHYALLDLLLSLQNPKPRSDIFNVPIYHNDNLPPLHFASRMGDLKIVQRLLRVCDPRQKDINGRTALHHIAELGFSEIVQLLCTSKIPLAGKDRNGETALHVAARKGFEDKVQIMVGLGADTNMKDNLGRTALSIAVEEGHQSAVKVLASGGADINLRYQSKRTVLHIAAENDDGQMVQVLVELGADINARNIHKQTATCILASHKGLDGPTLERFVKEGMFAFLRSSSPLRVNASALQAMVCLGVDINATDPTSRCLLELAAGTGNETAIKFLLSQIKPGPGLSKEAGEKSLHTAAKNGHEGVVKLLLARGDIDSNTQSLFGLDTPLHVAVENRHLGVVKLLLERQDVNLSQISISTGHTPLSLAAQNGDEEMVQLLLDGGDIDLNPSIDHEAHTPLSVAAEYGHEGVVKILLGRPDVDINPGSGRLHHPLSFAALNGHEGVVKLLIEKEGIDLNPRFGQGFSPLSLAAWKGHAGVVRLLLEKDGIIHNPGFDQRYHSLPLAAESGHEEVVELLLKRKDIDLNSTFGKRHTPLSIAARNGHEAVVKLLLDREEIDINHQVGDDTAMSLAKKMGHEGVVKLLHHKALIEYHKVVKRIDDSRPES